MASEYISDELFHFVGHASPKDDEANYDRLKKVLRDRCISHPPHDGTSGRVGYTMKWSEDLVTERLIVPDFTCYADIPFEALGIHVSKYGRFGLALPAKLLTKYGARPVTYIPMRSDDWGSINGQTLVRDIEAVVKAHYELVVQESEDSEASTRRLGDKPGNAAAAANELHHLLIKDFLAFIKPFYSELPHNHPNNYYSEREWRKYGNMRFDEGQVSRVVVAKGFKARLAADFPEHATRIYEL